MGGNNAFFENFERNILKKLPSMQRVNGNSNMGIMASWASKLVCA